MKDKTSCRMCFPIQFLNCLLDIQKISYRCYAITGYPNPILVYIQNSVITCHMDKPEKWTLTLAPHNLGSWIYGNRSYRNNCICKGNIFLTCIRNVVCDRIQCSIFWQKCIMLQRILLLLHHYTYHTTWHHIQEDNYLHSPYYKNFTTHQTIHSV